jgi:hypothetical protein
MAAGAHRRISSRNMPNETEQDRLYGLAVQFDSPEAVLHAARAVYAAGYRRVESYTPHAVQGLADALGFRKTGIPLMVLVGGALGALGGYFMLWYANVISYPWNIGGRPPNSWPAYIPITFEMTVLGASLLALLGMLALNGLPQPYHPVFKIPNFELASQTDYFLCIEAGDLHFEKSRTRALLETLNPKAILEVPW